MNSIRTSILIFLLVTVALTSFSCGKQPIKRPTRTLRSFEVAAFGLSNKYQVSPYPVDNFGAFTAYSPTKAQAWDESNQICATWSCLGIELASIPTDPSQRLTLNGFADVGGGGTITLSDDTQKSFGVTLLLPGLAKLLDIKGNIDWKSNVTVKLQLGVTHKRVLNRIKSENYIRNLQPQNPLRIAYERGELVLIIADLIVDSLDARINVDQNLNAAANTALSQASQTTQLPIGREASLNAKIESNGKGEYHLEVKNPVVLAVYAARQPSGGTLGQSNSGDPWSDWKHVDLPFLQ